MKESKNEDSGKVSLKKILNFTNEIENKDLLVEKLSKHFGYKFDPKNIDVIYAKSEEVLNFFFVSPRQEHVAVRVDATNKLTIVALHYASAKHVDPHICMRVKDILSGVSRSTRDNPPSERIFGMFVSWCTSVGFKNAVLTPCSRASLWKLSKDPCFEPDSNRYIPSNFTVEDLSAFLPATGDLPKTIKFAKTLYNEKRSREKNLKIGLQHERS